MTDCNRLERSAGKTNSAKRTQHSLLQCLHSVAPRSKHGVSHPFHTVITIVLLGVPTDHTITEILKRISIKDLQNGFRNLFFAIGRWRISCIWRRTRSTEDKHVFRSGALGEVWTFLTGMAGAVVRLTEKERTLREGRERLRAKPQNARQM
ncbi:MAG: hypothetical protein LBH00_07735 [Planctomycetaceae bacterium]|nr:hypothetical protein [Planctomycetaceae bacterium]